MSKNFQDFVDSLELKSPNFEASIESLLKYSDGHSVLDLNDAIVTTSLEILRQYHLWLENSDE